MKTIFVADRVWDGVADEAIARGFVAIEGEKIEAVGRAADLPVGSTVTDLGDATLLPGLINAHVHITFSSSRTVLDDYLSEKEGGVDVLTRRAEDNLQRAIGIGITTVRDLGTLNAVIFPMRERIRSGTFAGPDIIAAGEGITSHGGHCYFFGIEAEGVDDLRAAVRRQRDAGAEVIKVFATGGNLTPNTDPFSPQYSLEELRAVVDEANACSLHVASHAHAPEGIRRSVAANVSTIEHCFFDQPKGIEFDERVVEEMAAKQITVVPTMGASIRKFIDDPSLIDSVPEPGRTTLRRVAGRYKEIEANFRRMMEMGVRLIAGTDAGIPERTFDSLTDDLSMYSDDDHLGLGPRRALRSATSEAAAAIGVSDRGVLAPGKRADLLAVDGDPLATITDIGRTKLVVASGRPVGTAS